MLFVVDCTIMCRSVINDNIMCRSLLIDNICRPAITDNMQRTVMNYIMSITLSLLNLNN